MVFYRKYRPQTIAELDNQKLRDTLYGFVSKGQIPQAFLFTGPKGLGKTSTARILAKVVNCENKSKVKSQKSKLQVKTQNLETLEPCNQCTQCVSVTNGNNIDVLEIDGASNRGIDEIRDLREKIKLVPVSAKKKVYIIDEVHMLTTEAFNALLKTLEEPPQHAMFIFCTTESHKVPATIVSRCFHIQLEKASDEDLIHAFKRIALGEHLTITDDAYASIARLSDGSFRDGTKILEEIVLKTQGETITSEVVEKIYKTTSIANAVLDICLALSKKDQEKALGVVSTVVSWGIDMRFFMEQILLKLDSELLIHAGVVKEKSKPHFSLEEIKQLAPILLKAYEDTRFTPVAQLPLELAIVEWSLEDKEQKTEEVKGEAVDKPEVKSIDHEQRSVGNISNGSFDWPAFIERVKSRNQIVAGLLRSCGLKRIDASSMVIEAGYKFHKDKLDTSETLALISSVYEAVSGNKVGVSVILKDS